jgi:transcriptional regulator with GAF, ATPase, and Fis domain
MLARSILDAPETAAAAAAAAVGGSSSSSEDAELLQGFLPPLQLPLDALPSVQAVCRGRRLLFTSSFSQQHRRSSISNSSNVQFSDWQQLAESYEAECFLAVPLCFAQQDLGCLLLMAEQPAAVDKYARKLVIELGLVMAQTLYTLLCMQQMRAGDQIINDMMPQQVRSTAADDDAFREVIGRSQCSLCLLRYRLQL